MVKRIKRGFTLVELVVALGVSTILITLCIAFINFVSTYTLKYETDNKELFAADNLATLIKKNVDQARNNSAVITFFDCDSEGYNVDSSITSKYLPDGYTKKVTCLYFYEIGSRAISVRYGCSDNNQNNEYKLFYLDYQKTYNTPNPMSDLLEISIKGSKKTIESTTTSLMMYTISYRANTKNFNFSIKI